MKCKMQKMVFISTSQIIYNYKTGAAKQRKVAKIIRNHF